MGFLVITCIGPVSKFLGIIPLSWSMVIMAAIILAIAGYTYYEAQVYFDKTKVFGFVDKTVYLVIGKKKKFFNTFVPCYFGTRRLWFSN